MQRPVSTYIDSDDGLHPFENPEYYEWWYLDARFDNGYSCVLTWHWRNEFLKPHIPTIQLFIYTPEGKRFVGLDAVDIKDCSAGRDSCDVKMGASYLRQENGVYKMSMYARNVGCELAYEGILPGWKAANDGHFPGGKLDRGWAGWVIPCPRAKVEGKLVIKGQEIPVSGDGYHDHNWGDIDLYDLFKGWYWGRLNDPKYTIIFSCTTTLKNAREPYLFIADLEGTILSTTKYDFAVEQEESDPATGHKYAKVITLKYKGQDVTLDCRLDTRRIAEHSPLPKVNEYDMFNWRFLADYEGLITVDGKADRISGQTIHERLLFRP